jgi:hypothetical protein
VATVAVGAVPATVIPPPAPAEVPLAVASQAPEAPTVEGPEIVIDAPTVDVTLPPTDTAPLGNGAGAQNFGGVLVLLGGLLVLAAAFIARRQPARR